MTSESRRYLITGIHLQKVQTELTCFQNVKNLQPTVISTITYIIKNFSSFVTPAKKKRSVEFAFEKEKKLTLLWSF